MAERQPKAFWRSAYEAGARARVAGETRATASFWERALRGEYLDVAGFDFARLADASDAATLFFEAGIEGHAEPSWVTGMRLGRIAPGQECSRNYRDDVSERGVSVLHLDGAAEQTDGTFRAFARENAPLVHVGGFLAPWPGSDGEPLLIAAEELGAAAL